MEDKIDLFSSVCSVDSVLTSSTHSSLLSFDEKDEFTSNVIRHSAILNDNKDIQSLYLDVYYSPLETSPPESDGSLSSDHDAKYPTYYPSDELVVLYDAQPEQNVVHLFSDENFYSVTDTLYQYLNRVIFCGLF